MHVLRLFFSVLGEFQAPPVGMSRLQWIHLDANILEMMPSKTWEKKIVLVRVDMVWEMWT